MNYLEIKKKALHLIVGKVKGFVRSVTGTPPISLEACADNASIIDYKIHGNSIQDGEPSPDNPIEVQSVGELVTDESDVHYGKYKIPVTARSKNLFNISTSKGFVSTDSRIKNIINKNSITVTNNADREITTTLTLGEFEAGTYYIGMTSDGEKFKCIVFANDKNTQKYTNNIFVFTGKAVVNVLYFLPAGITTTIENIQITKSDIETDYEPYHEPITTNIYLDEPLRKVGDYADYIDFKNSIVVRKTHTIALSECSYTLRNVLLDNGFVRAGYFEQPSQYYMKFGTQLCGFCNALPANNEGWDVPIQESIHFGQSNATFYIYTKSAYASKEELLNYLGDAKATYILRNSTQTSISLPILPTFKGITTIYEVGTTIQPSNMEAEYYSTLKGD